MYYAEGFQIEIPWTLSNCEVDQESFLIIYDKNLIKLQIFLVINIKRQDLQLDRIIFKIFHIIYYYHTRTDKS